MKLIFEFAPYFSSMIGGCEYSVEIAEGRETLGRAVTALFEQHPEIEDPLRRGNAIVNGKIRALFLANDTLVQDESAIAESSVIRVIAPVCGG